MLNKTNEILDYENFKIYTKKNGFYSCKVNGEKAMLFDDDRYMRNLARLRKLSDNFCSTISVIGLLLLLVLSIQEVNFHSIIMMVFGFILYGIHNYTIRSLHKHSFGLIFLVFYIAMTYIVLKKIQPLNDMIIYFTLVFNSIGIMRIIILTIYEAVIMKKIKTDNKFFNDYFDELIDLL